MKNITFQVVQPNETKTIKLIAEWYLNEWKIPIEKTIARISSFTEFGEEFQVLLLQDNIPVSTGGLYHKVGLHSKEPRFEKYKNWLAQVYTTPSHRHNGLGALICNHIQELSKTKNIREILLFTDTAESLYTRLGWATIERLSYDIRNVVVMNKVL